MGRRRKHEELVCADQVAPVLSCNSGRQASWRNSTATLRRPRFLRGAALAQWLKAHAKRLGFSDAKITNPQAISTSHDQLHSWLSQGYHASMEWMENRSNQRANPTQLWDQTQSILMVALNYGPNSNPLENLDYPDRATISVYARGKDYHDVIKSRLKQLARDYVEKSGALVKVFTDTAPVMEKPLAHAAGLGWQGKHTALVSREFGAWLFLGALYTNLKMPTDQPHQDRCGNCRKCLDICPTNAFPKPYILDANKCIAYLTNEHKGPIPLEFRSKMGNRIYGCDDCLAVCPWNKFAKITHEHKLQAREDLNSPKLMDFLTMDDLQFRNHFSGSPIKRIGRSRFLRNVLIAVGNARLCAAQQQVELLLQDESPLIRGAAIWAYGKIAKMDDVQNFKNQLLPFETDHEVINEWQII